MPRSQLVSRSSQHGWSHWQKPWICYCSTTQIPSLPHCSLSAIEWPDMGNFPNIIVEIECSACCNVNLLLFAFTYRIRCGQENRWFWHSHECREAWKNLSLKVSRLWGSNFDVKRLFWPFLTKIYMYLCLLWVSYLNQNFPSKAI